MKTKFLLPMLAMIVAIGMSFTTVNKTVDLNQDYILVNGTYEPIGEELECGMGTSTCRVQFSPDGPEHNVYDAVNDTEPKEGNGILIKRY